jgi:predicted metal-dependent hydrolase
VPPHSDAFIVTTELDLGPRTAPLVARVNRRARRLIVRVDEFNGRVLVTAPSRRALPDAIRFAKSRARWILKRFDEGLPARPFAAGSLCPFRGTPHLIVNGGSLRAPVRRLEGDPPRIVVGGDPAHVNRRLVDWLKTEARAALQERTALCAGRLGRRVARISVRDGKSRWGSCSREGAISYSWRLILAPPDILDYVVAHECAHLVHLNHSPDFYRTQASLGADETTARRWFSENGAALHAFGVVKAS